MEVIDDMGRSRSSPRSFRAWRRGRRWSGIGDQRWPDFGMPSSSTSTRSFLGQLAWQRSFEAARRGLGMPTAVALEFAGARVSVTGFRQNEREWGRRRTGETRVCCGSGGVLIADEERRRSSSASNHRWLIKRLPELHPAAWRKEEDDGLLRCVIPKRYLDQAPSGLVRWTERMGKLPLFFSDSFLFLFVLFTGFNSTIWIQTYFARFWIWLLIIQILGIL
jgi:hypothetical protein